MSENQIHLEIELSVNSEILYSDWLDSMAHSLFTGGEVPPHPNRQRLSRRKTYAVVSHIDKQHSRALRVV